MKRIVAILDRLADHGVIVVVCAVAIIIIFGSIVSLREGDRVKSLDEVGILDIARNVCTHFRYAQTNSTEITAAALGVYDPAYPAGAIRPTALRAPGYTLFIAPFVYFGGSYPILRIVNHVVMSMTLVLMYYLLATGYSRLAGLLGAIFVLGYPIILYTAGTLYPQTLQSFLLILAVWLLCRTRPDASLWVHALPGVIFGLAILTNPIVLLLAPIVLLWQVVSGRSRIQQAAVTASMMVLLSGAWTIRNYVALHAFVPGATTSGYNLVSGNSDATTYDQLSGSISLSETALRELNGKGEIERDRIMSREAMRYIRANPARTFKLYCQKLLYWFAYSNQLASDVVIKDGASDVSARVRNIIMFCSYIPLLGVFLVRLFLVRRFPLSDIEVLFVTLYLASGMAYAIYITRIRYRMPFDWMLIALDAIFLSQVIASWSAQPKLLSPANGDLRPMVPRGMSND
jgi:Dolichyl-phosphate-mannose-protein mannosyltransferase